MKKKQKKKKSKSNKPKINKKFSMSKMVINFAQDFIRLGNTIEVRQSYLNAACVAWNISLLSESARPTALNQFLEQYQELNPGRDDVDNVRKDIELLIDEKIEMYPDEKRAVVNAQIIDDNKGNERIIVISKK